MNRSHHQQEESECCWQVTNYTEFRCLLTGRTFSFVPFFQCRPVYNQDGSIPQSLHQNPNRTEHSKANQGEAAWPEPSLWLAQLSPGHLSKGFGMLREGTPRTQLCPYGHPQSCSPSSRSKPLPSHSPQLLGMRHRGGSRAFPGRDPTASPRDPHPWVNAACPAQPRVQPSRSRLWFGTVPSLPSQHSHFWELLLLNTEPACYQPPPELCSCPPSPSVALVEKTDFLLLLVQDRASQGQLSPSLLGQQPLTPALRG